MQLMKLVILAFAAIVATQTAQAVDPIRFLGVDYFVAYQAGAPNSDMLNEFLPRGQKLKSWKTLLAVRYYHSAQAIEDALVQWGELLQNSDTPGATLRELKDEVEDRQRERIFQMSIRPRGDAYLELNTWRFVKTDDGSILSYQYARRVNPRDKEELMDAFMNSTDVLEEIKLLTHRPLTKSL